MVVSEIVKKLIDINGEKQVAESEPMSRHTTFRIGGPAKVFVSPDNIEKIIKTIELLKNEKCDLSHKLVIKFDKPIVTAQIGLLYFCLSL